MKKVIYIIKVALSPRGLIKYLIDVVRFNRIKDKRFVFSLKELFPVVDEATTETKFDRHYVYHPAWAARIVKKINPKIHVDISSTLHFCTMLSAFIPTDFYDYRPADLKLSKLRSKYCDLLNLTFKSNSIESLSCLHTLEHIGLGRYGDQLDSEVTLKQ